MVPTDSFKIGVEFIEACRGVGFEPRIAYQTFSFESAKGFVRQGLCVAVLPRMALGTGANEGIAILRIEDRLSRQLNLIRGRDRSLTGVARALMAHVKRSTALEDMAELSGPEPPRPTAADDLGTRRPDRTVRPAPAAKS